MGQRDADEPAAAVDRRPCVDRIAAMPAKHRKNVPIASASIDRAVLIEVLSDKPEGG